MQTISLVIHNNHIIILRKEYVHENQKANCMVFSQKLKYLDSILKALLHLTITNSFDIDSQQFNQISRPTKLTFTKGSVRQDFKLKQCEMFN
jgi:hypothetical protein